MVVKCRNRVKSAERQDVGKCVRFSSYYGATIVGPITKGNFAETSGKRLPCQRRSCLVQRSHVKREQDW
jgi:hypothetical protein